MADPKRANVDELPAAAGILGQMMGLQLQDRRLGAAAFFMAWGSCIIVYGTVLNRSASADYVLAGFVLWTIGAALLLLTLAGADRAAAGIEETLRAFF